MGVFSRFRRKKEPYAALTDEERIARYVYLLNTLPASVIESAHASAFKELPPEKRREMFEQLRPFMSDAERETASDDPTVLAKLVRRAQERRSAQAGGMDAASSPTARSATDTVEPGPELGGPRDFLRDPALTALVALHFMNAHAINSYFLFGAGSLTIGDQPAWIGEMVDPGSTGIDAGGVGGGFDGGGFDGGGFDAGGFGGFDGGGGFG